ncbi:MAG: hypothetical protein JXR39_11635 [Marinilabiliaceae bacterium]|nr:hypothetical protein [Marinilabiliaceae bacterium]
MKTRNYLIYSLLASVFMLTPGCAGDDIYEKDINTDANRVYEMHIVGGAVTVNGLDLIDEFGDGDFIIDNDSLIMRRFEMPMTMEWDELVSFQSPEVNQIIPIAAGSLTSISQVIEMSMNPSADVRLDAILLDAGRLHFTITAPIGITNATMTVSFPELQRANGSTLSYTQTITASQRTLVIQENLAQAVIKFLQKTDIAPHNSYITLKIGFTNIAANSGGNIQVDGAFSELSAEQVNGYFGNKTLLKSNNEFEFDMFDKYELQNKVQFSDFRVYVQGINPIGTPFKLDVENIRFSQKDKAGTEWVFADNSNNPLTPSISLNAATGPTPLVPDTTETISYNRDNSNIELLGEKYPNFLVCNLKGLSNPQAGSDTKNIHNFMGRNRTVSADIKIDFPFWFKTIENLQSKGYMRTDTIDFDFRDMVDNDEDVVESFERLMINLEFTNGMPFSITAALNVVDENDKFIANLLETDNNKFLEKPTIDKDYKVTSPSVTNFSINVSKEKIKKFWNEKAMKILLVSTMITSDTPNSTVKIYTNNTLKCRVNMNAKCQIPN